VQHFLAHQTHRQQVRFLLSPACTGQLYSPLRDGKIVTPGERHLRRSMIYLENTISGPVTELRVLRTLCDDRAPREDDGHDSFHLEFPWSSYPVCPNRLTPSANGSSTSISQTRYFRWRRRALYDGPNAPRAYTTVRVGMVTIDAGSGPNPAWADRSA
jgi:hypothetical protein